MSNKVKKHLIKGTVLTLGLLTLLFYTPTKANTNLFFDDFTGPTLNTGLWNVIGAGYVMDNDTVQIFGSNTPSWGSAGLVSWDTFERNGLSVSANMSGVSSETQILGYGDFNIYDNKSLAYGVVLSGGSVFATVWDGGVITAQINCGFASQNSKYEMRPTALGFDVYMDDLLLCSSGAVNTGLDNVHIWLQSDSATVFDNVSVDSLLSVPSAPQNVVASASRGEATVTWDAPVSDGGVPGGYYHVVSDPDNIMIDTTDTSVTLDGLSYNTPYTFTVYAINDIGISSPSDPSAPVSWVATVPDSPTNVVARDGDTQATVTWEAPLNDGGIDIIDYVVTSNPDKIIAHSDGNSTIVTGLTNDISYTFTVIAVNIIGDSKESSESNPVIPSIYPTPDKATDLVATGVNRQVLLSWRKPVGYDVSGYRVEYKPSSYEAWDSAFTLDDESPFTKRVISNLDNNQSYDFRVTTINGDKTGPLSDVVSATPHSIDTLAFVFTGESNSGGEAFNASATVEELAPRPSVQITNLTSGNFLYENLDIGVNNLRDHLGLYPNAYTERHGFELQLANSVEAHEFPGISQVYLTKTGQGGTNLSYWITHKSYAGIYPWDKFVQRVTAAKTQLPENRQWVVWLNEGMNDYWNGVGGNTAAYKSGMLTYINNIKAQLPGAIIVMTQFQSVTDGFYSGYDLMMDELAAEEPNVYVVSSDKADMQADNLHWSYDGLKTIGSRMVGITRDALGMYYPSEPTNLSASPINKGIDLSWSSPLAIGSSEINNYGIYYSVSGADSWEYVDVGVDTSFTLSNLAQDTSYDLRTVAYNSYGAGSYATMTAATLDITPPSLLEVNTDNLSGVYKTGDLINFTINFSENVSSEGGATLFLNSNGYCNFNVAAASSVNCAYTVASGDINTSLNVDRLEGVIKDAAGNELAVPAIPSNRVADSKTIMVYGGESVISNIVAVPSTASAVITWDTNELASSSVEYGLNTSYGSGVSDDNFVNSHSITLSSLQSCTSYHYRVRGIDIYTNDIISGDKTFTTTGCSSGSSFTPSVSIIYSQPNQPSKPEIIIIPSGTLAKEKGNKNVYLIEGKLKRLIPDEATFLANKFNWSDIKEYSSLKDYLDGELLSAPEIIPEKIVVKNTKIFVRPLRYGMSGGDVKKMQEYFMSQGGEYPGVSNSSYFGKATLAAVKKFQLKYKLVKSIKEPAYGYVGPSTRAKLESLIN